MFTNSTAVALQFRLIDKEKRLLTAPTRQPATDTGRRAASLLAGRHGSSRKQALFKFGGASAP